MDLEGPIRKNISTLLPKERDSLVQAFMKLHTDPLCRYEGERTESEKGPPYGGVTFWFKYDEIHQGTHVHGGAAFLPWHRELCNRLEDDLRKVDPSVSLHYWDWNNDPTEIPLENGLENGTLNLFTPELFGNAVGPVEGYCEKNKFYVSTADPYRSDIKNDPKHSNPFDPPRRLRRNKTTKEPPVFIDPRNGNKVFKDDDIINATTFKDMRTLLELAHNTAHGYIGGNLRNSHISFRDPFVFLLHSNVDRLFAMWQYKNPDVRLKPESVYGSESNTESEIVIDEGGEEEVRVGISCLLAPWAGYSVPEKTNKDMPPRCKPVRPWAPPENWHLKEENVKNSKHISVVVPRRYDSVLKMTGTH